MLCASKMSANLLAKKLFIEQWWNLLLGSISPTFTSSFCAQIPWFDCLFAPVGSVSQNAAYNHVGEIDPWSPGVNFINALARADPESEKKESQVVRLFCSFGICEPKSCKQRSWWNGPVITCPSFLWFHSIDVSNADIRFRRLVPIQVCCDCPFWVILRFEKICVRPHTH